MLTERYGHMDLTNVLTDAERFAPFPRASDRAAWSAVSAASRELWLSEAEHLLSYEWPAIKVSNAMTAKETGQLWVASDPFYDRRTALGKLVIGACLDGGGRFLGQVVNGIMCICEETLWRPGHPTELDPEGHEHVVDLMSGETAALLAWTYFLLKDRLDEISINIGRRIVKEVRTRVLEPYLSRNDDWWMGFQPNTRVNNWNPWCNCNCLMAFLLLEDDPEVRSRGIRKIMQSLDRFILTHPGDGCCDEGPMYWEHSGGSLYDCLDLLSTATEGKIDIFDEQIVHDIGSYIYKVHIDGQYYANFADGDAKVRQYPDVVYGYGTRIGDERLQRLGATIPVPVRDYPYWFPLYRYVRNLFHESKRTAPPEPPYIRDAWLDRTQVMTAREREGSKEGLYVAAKAGHNLESHNHNDVGNFIVYADGKPVLIDLGMEQYTAKAFSPQRYEIWTLSSAYHNVPTVRGVQQHAGGEFRASDVSYSCSDEAAEMTMNIAGAYPQEAGIASWLRTVRLRRGGEPVVEVRDDFALSEPASDVYHSLMTPCRPEERSAGIVLLENADGRSVTLEYDSERLALTCELIRIDEQRLLRNWGDTLYRLVLTEKETVAAGERTLQLSIV